MRCISAKAGHQLPFRLTWSVSAIAFKADIIVSTSYVADAPDADLTQGLYLSPAFLRPSRTRARSSDRTSE
jgi:hypothetical protein